MDLDGKVAIVTGAASKHGIGCAVAMSLAREGADIALADIAFDGVQALAEEIKGMGRKALALRVDQGNYNQVQEAVAKVNQDLGSADILVNNAALINKPAPMRKTSPSDWDREVSVNLNGVFYWTREVLPIMTENRWGRIINISSLAGITGAPGLPCYSACKGGLIAFTKAVGIETAKRGVTVNSLSLGFIQTSVFADGLAAPEVLEAITKSLPMGRMGAPHEVAHLVTFLASDKAAYIHGENIVLDGGIMAGFTSKIHM